MKKFYRFMIFINIIIILAFCVLFFKKEISGFIYSQTGYELNIPDISFDWIAFWKKNEKNGKSNLEVNNQQGRGDGSQVKLQNEQSGQSTDESNSFTERLENLEGNTIIGINYSGIGDGPETLERYADRIVKAKIKSVSTVAYENVVRSEIIAQVKKTYKGESAKEIRIYSFGGNVNVSDLKDGQIKDTASKTDSYGESVNVLMDFCEEIEEGKEYIIFASNAGGVLSPVNGNMSFFKVEGGNVKRVSAEDNEFSMKFRDFEKNYLK